MGRLADRPGARARLRRRALPIHAYVGPNGTGKSAVMIYDTLPSLDMGRPVLSTVRLLDFRDPRPCDKQARFCDDPAMHELTEMQGNLHRAAHPLYVRLDSYQQFLDWKDGDVLLDEVTGIASSRESSSMPAEIANRLVQLRRRNISLRWSAPAWGRADIIIRECSQGVTLMSASMPKRTPPSSDGTPRLWNQRRLFTARTYDPVQMDEFEAHRADHIPHEVIAFYWGPGSLMFSAYDTLDAITSLSGVSDAGRCLSCNGKRTPHKCSCQDHGRQPVATEAQRGAEGEARPAAKPRPPRTPRPRAASS